MECPDCETDLNEEKNHLTDEEWTVIISCPSCNFELETESNLVHQERQKRMREQADVRI